ncbi:MAG: tetratricopeptide repeat protein [Phycisphaeraceae bacterium]
MFHLRCIIVLASLAAFAGPALAEDYESIVRDALAAARDRKFDEAIKLATKAIELKPDNDRLYQFRGELNFKASRFKESVADFDKYLAANPKEEPQHWQRGLSHYYAAMYKEGVKQFEIHRTVNPEDVENSVWHYLCNAKIVGPEKARDVLIPIKDDGRKWAPAVYEMYRGKMKPEEVLHAAEVGKQGEGELKNNRFYAHLYIGLYYESLGKMEEAKKHIDLAAEKYLSSHYMGDVALVHAKLLKKTESN